MDQRRYLEAAGLRFTEFGGFMPANSVALPSLVAEWAEAVLERAEEGHTTVVAFVPLRAGSLLTAVRDELAAYLGELARSQPSGGLALLVVLSEEPVSRELYERTQRLTCPDGRLRLVPWIVDLTRDRLYCHLPPPAGIDPDLAMLASPGDEPPIQPQAPEERAQRRIRPSAFWMTISLAVTIVAIWLVMTGQGGALDATERQIPLMERWGAVARPNMFMTGEYWRLFTAGFLHFGAVHLAMNTLSLWWVGQVVETFFGPVRMLLVYLIALVAGSVGSALLGPSISVGAGASGAIMGLLGAVIWYRLAGPHRERLKHMNILSVLLLNLVYGLMNYRTIDNWNHLGGLIGGFLAAMAVGMPGQAGPKWSRAVVHGVATAALLLASGAAVAGLVPLPGPSQRLAAALVAWDKGELTAAKPGLVEAAEDHPDQPELQIMLAYIYYSEGRIEESRALLDKALRADPRNEAAQEFLEQLK